LSFGIELANAGEQQSTDEPPPKRQRTIDGSKLTFISIYHRSCFYLFIFLFHVTY